MIGQSGKIVLVLVLLLLILGAAVYFFLPVFKNKASLDFIVTNSPIPMDNSYEESNSTGGVEDYYSKALQIKFQIPEGAKITEKFTDILINLPNGLIQIRRIGTNFTNIKDYFLNLKEKNKLKLLTEEWKKVNSFDSVLTTMKGQGDESKTIKEYSLYVDNWVFKFSTSDEALYPVLDQIVESFEYKP